MSQAENNKRIAKNSIYMSIRMVIVLCITLYTTRAILDVLGVEDYGIYNVVCGFVSMLAFLNTSMSNGIQRFFNFEYGKNGEAGANRVYNTALIIQSMLGIVILILAESLGLWYMYEKMVIPAERFYAALWIFQLSLISFLFIIMQAPYTAAVMAHEKMDFYAIVSVLDAVLKLGIVFVIPLLDGDGLIIYCILLSLISVLNFILYYVYCKKNFREIKFHIMFDKALFRSMLGFSGWNVFGSFAGVMKEHGINLVLNLFFGPIVNAARGISYQINSGLQSFIGNIMTTIRPQLIQSYAKKEFGRTKTLMFSMSKFSCCFLYMIALPVVLELNFILKIWLGDNIPEHTQDFVIIVILISFINNLNSAVSAVVHASGRMRNYQLITSFISLLCIPSAYFGLKMGACPEFALLSILFFVAISQISAILILKTIIDLSVKEYLKMVIIPFLLYAIPPTLASLLPILLMETGVVRFLATTTIGIGVSLLSIYALALSKSEKELALSIIKNR